MDVNDVREILQEAHQLTQVAAVTNIVDMTIGAYDAFAAAAMQGLLASSLSEDEVVARAWKMADAMMVERQKRGLGKLPEGK